MPNSSIIAVFTCDVCGRFTSFNSNICRILGRTPSLQESVPEFLNACHIQHLDGTPMSVEQCPVLSAIRTGEEHSSELTVRRGGQEPLTILATASPVFGPGGEISGATAVLVDITQREKDRSSLALFRTLIDNIPDCIEVIDPETGGFLDVNEFSCKLHGYTREEFLGLCVTDIDSSLSPSSWNQFRDELKKSGRMVCHAEHRCRDGSVFPVEVNAAFIHLDRDYFLAVVRDMSDQRAVRSLLRESEQKWRAIATTMPHALYIFDIPSAKNVYMNREVWSDLGYTAADFPEGGRDILNKLLHPEDLARVPELLSRWDNVCDGEILETEYRMRHASGEWHWFLGRDTVFHRDDNGRVVQVIGTAQDVTEWKRAEQTLRENETRLRLSIQSANIGSWEWDIQCNEVRFSPEWKQQLGYQDDELADDYMEWEGRLHPQDRERVLKALQDYFIHKEADYAIEFRLRHRDGSYRWIYTRGTARWDKNGQPVRMMGCHVDITERRRAEDTIHQFVEVLAHTTGQEFFTVLVQNLSKICQVEYAFAASVDASSPDEIQTIAAARNGNSIANVRYRMHGTPCEHVVRRSLCYFPSHVQERFPEDQMLAKLGAESYMGIPLWASDGQPLGLLVLLHTGPMNDAELTRATLQIVAVRCGAELERKRAEELLRKSEERLLSVVRNTPNVAIQWYDSDGQVRLWNEASETLYGYHSAEVVGRRLAELDPPPKDPTTLGLAFEELRNANGAAAPSEYSFQQRDGRKGTCLSSIFRIPGDEDNDLFVCMDVDITERKQAEEERRHLEKQLLHAQKLESLGVLAGGIAHDFNNLLTSMMGYASLAQADVEAESSVSDMLREIEKAAQRAAQLTQQLLAYAGKGRFVVEPVRLDAVVEDLARLLATVISRKAAVTLDLQPTVIHGDASQIQQVVMNLITNASDALGGENGRIRIRTGVRHVESEQLTSLVCPDPLPTGDYAFLEVEDTGTGMTAETVARIFDPFFTTKFAGRGLGLAAVLGIVRSHKGTIHVDSRSGTGTRFEVLFPASSVAVMPKVGSKPASGYEKGQGEILLIEDDPNVRLFTKHTLEKAGFTVRIAVDGREGVDEFRHHRDQIVVVLLDLTMPKKDGTEVLREIRELSPKVPILVMSGFSEQDVLSRCTRLGATGFLQKPFLPRRLLTEVNGMLETAHRVPA
ncbi:MAG: PAS domain S-box protein [Planctomycetaceae bacterium]